jgi:ribosomal protein L16 Arg81 hydroxylase
VLQIAGSKRWRIHGPPLPLLHRSQPFDPRSYVPSAPLLEVDLTSGDLLYLPRGFVHTTATSDSFSVHVTRGITVYTWVELLADWIQSSKNNPSFRPALPPGFAEREDIKQSLKDQLPRIITELQRATDYDGLVDGLAKRCWRSHRRAPTSPADQDHEHCAQPLRLRQAISPLPAVRSE